MDSTYKKVRTLFPSNSGRKLVIFVILLLISAVLEMLGVGLIMPLIAIIDKPEIIQSNQWLNMIYANSHTQSYKDFLIWCSVLLIIFYILKNIFTGSILYWQSKFLAKSEAYVSTQLLENYLFMPYEKYISRNPASLVTNINHETTSLFAGYIKPLFIIITDSFIVLSILALLIYVAPFATLAAVGIIGFSGAVFYLPLRKPLSKLGKSRQFHREKMFQWINQSLGSLKEIVVLGRRSFFKESFIKHADETVITQTFYETVTQLPRLIIESIGVITLLTVTIVVLYSTENFLPTLSLFAMAAFRLMPAMNRITSCVAKLRYYSNSLNTIYNDLVNIDANSVIEDKKPLLFTDKIVINNINYAYPSTQKNILKSIYFEIPRFSSIGIIGQSGAGKSTLVDILLGLLLPGSGQITIDGTDLNQCLHSWRKHISYIPQVIYLTDDTIRRNIALGLKDSEIDDNKIWQALEQAELADVIRQMPEGLDTTVGERGIRLSGGQRQRIGIARAFYNEPEVLILDEATTGLDPKTENAICDTLRKMKHKLTMIAISHQPALTAVADKVYVLEKGTLSESDKH
ncbi:MAG: ABC-type multidrug transport system, ATPase and permease component [Rickettsiaceae bacterium]|jgi:ATP-binding cassette subfamily C protein|nr:ABC-type multidrug transport system, ATPase and permease component [Rickettsiaceae bacterium]